MRGVLIITLLVVGPLGCNDHYLSGPGNGGGGVDRPDLLPDDDDDDDTVGPSDDDDAPPTGADYDPPFPRIGLFQWGGGPPEMYARYDLIEVDFARAASSLSEEIKAIHPETIIVGVKEWRVCDYGCPEEWQIQTSQGEPIILMSTHYADPTDYCGTHDGQRFNEYLPLSYIEEFDFGAVDGVGTCGIHRYSWDLLDLTNNQYGAPDVDLDRNGLNDLDEPGKGEEWVETEFVAGCDELIDNMRDALATNGLDDRPLVLNAGTLITEWGAGVVNGWIDEYCSTNRYWGTGFLTRYAETVALTRQPSLVLINGVMDHKDDFADMRFLLTETMMSDGYFDVEEFDSKDHYYKEYYDEFDLDLGYPTGDYQQLDSGVAVRFFDRGVAITNATGASQTVSDEVLQGLVGYDGPYHHLRGGQDPAVNHGGPFTSHTLDCEVRDDENGNGRYYGDGLILVEQPLVVVADIVVDHTSSVTSAGSDKADLSENWTETCCNGDPCDDSWTWGCRYSYVTDTYDVAYSTDDHARAAFVPTIGYAGEYEVFEWHPVMEGATTVSIEIFHADGVASGTLDQGIDEGSWVSLGTYRFEVGTAGYLALAGSHGMVVADAVKFVLQQG